MKLSLQNAFKHRLLRVREELEGELSQLTASILAGASSFGEHDGCVSESIDKELSLEHAEEDLCQAVDGALVRLANGTFGRCMGCGKQIALRRLEAIPYTAFCIKCECEWEKKRTPSRGLVMTGKGNFFH